MGIRANVDEVAKSLQVHDGEPAKGKSVLARDQRVRSIGWLERGINPVTNSTIANE